MLSSEGITSDITVLDIAHTNAYDFSSVEDSTYLVPKESWINDIFQTLKASDYKIHMKNELMDVLYDILPSNGKCDIDKSLHNMTVDSDGKLRLCLRIRGNHVAKFDASEIFNENGHFSDSFDMAYLALKSEYITLCKGCSWTCPHMSKNGESDKIINH